MKKELLDLFARARILGAFNLDCKDQDDITIILDEDRIKSGVIVVRWAYLPTNGVMEDEPIERFTELKLDELFKYATIQELQNYCDAERENQRLMLKKERDRKLEESLRKAEEKDFKDYLRLKEKFKNREE
jgi:hypothetical protein